MRKGARLLEKADASFVEAFLCVAGEASSDDDDSTDEYNRVDEDDTTGLPDLADCLAECRKVLAVDAERSELQPR